MGKCNCANNSDDDFMIEEKECDCKCNSNCPEENRCKCGCDEFIYVYNTVTETIAAGAAFTFNNPAVPLIGDGLLYTTGQTFITITEPGVYQFEYLLAQGTSVGTVALFLNGVEIPGSRYAINGLGDDFGLGIFVVKCDDVAGMISLVNVGAAPLTFNPGGLANTVNISLLINRIN